MQILLKVYIWFEKWSLERYLSEINIYQTINLLKKTYTGRRSTRSQIYVLKTFKLTTINHRPSKNQLSQNRLKINSTESYCIRFDQIFYIPIKTQVCLIDILERGKMPWYCCSFGLKMWLWRSQRRPNGFRKEECEGNMSVEKADFLIIHDLLLISPTVKE